MLTLCRSALLYRERAGRETTWRGPVPACAPALNPVHTLQLTPPLPLPELLPKVGCRTGDGADGGLTTIWPGGVDGETVQPSA
jgi:hypothetical protein